MIHCRDIYKDDNAPLMAILWAVATNYGVKAFDWLPSILRNEIETEFCEISDLQADKIQAAITMATTNMYETDIRTFEVCSRLSSCTPQDFEDLDPLEAEEIISGIADIYLIKGEKIDFSDEVEVYAGKVFYDYGFREAPELFPTAILPNCEKGDECERVEGDDSGKNEALKEIFDRKISAVQSYMSKITNA